MTIVIFSQKFWYENWQRLRAFGHKHNASNKFAIFIVFAAVGSSLLTYSALTAQTPLANDATVVYWLLNLDVVFLLVLGGIVLRRVVNIWHRRRTGLSGARLHVQLVRTFSFIALVPALVMFIFASIFIYFVIQQWFGDRVRTAIDESIQVSEAYLNEHKQNIRADALAMASDLNHESSRLVGNPDFFAQLLGTQSLLRNLDEVVVMSSNGRILGRSGLSFSIGIQQLPPSIFEAARRGEVPIITADTEDRVRALVRLTDYADAYLYVGRFIDPKVLAYTKTAGRAVSEYKSLEGRKAGLQLTITIIFFVVALLLMLAAIWAGLWLAGRLVTPLAELIDAAERVRSGDLTARVGEENSYDEIASLQRAFNRMGVELHDAHQALEERTRQAAWSDVAQRIAHEIKNPLTPIQLAAERLKRKYAGEIKTEPAIFNNCIDTIIRQVGHVGRMVTEFSSFARLPQPQLKEENIVSIVAQAVFLERQAHADFNWVFDENQPPLTVMCDAQQIAQALTNILQNAADSIDGRDGVELPLGDIRITIGTHDTRAQVVIDDNGKGFPDIDRNRLLEPYMTTRIKGTGLGLAIVKKIIEDHGGMVLLTKRDDSSVGARVVLELPLAAPLTLPPSSGADKIIS